MSQHHHHQSSAVDSRSDDEQPPSSEPHISSLLDRNKNLPMPSGPSGDVLTAAGGGGGVHERGHLQEISLGSERGTESGELFDGRFFDALLRPGIYIDIYISPEKEREGWFVYVYMLYVVYICIYVHQAPTRRSG